MLFIPSEFTGTTFISSSFQGLNVEKGKSSWNLTLLYKWGKALSASLVKRHAISN